MMKKILMFVVMVMTLMACGSKTDLNEMLAGKTFTLDEKVVLEEQGEEVSFTLAFEDGRVSGRALNNFNANYEIEGDKIEISPMATTLMAGPEILMQREAEYLMDLTNAKTISLEGNKLTITTEEEKVLTFTQVEEVTE
ncbi:hypothetical protein PM10SUCC1_17320 [Propionigenium maris DSM 9537]|uniref:DUF306 domain-containing protein n=1 Tax=Propionigenium maris DSM 9537 TaxID=1123000 RepID=A0A9W6GKW3_9FUSO|nr:META domain-containing protein [Propionigenium maris]GLI56218.1 hypothetical protein PM10SUCC1_17320 [Propionigenium maris DSM 9537]